MAQLAKKRKANKMHWARCHICKSPHKEEIERRYLSWEPEEAIARDYKGISNKGIRRHAEAYGLVEIRSENVKGALNQILKYSVMEPTLKATASATTGIQASRLLSQLDGKLIEKTNNNINLNVNLEEVRKKNLKESLKVFGVNVTAGEDESVDVDDDTTEPD